MNLIVSCSLNPDSRSRIVAQHASDRLTEQSFAHDFVDLRDVQLPFCDASSCYSAPQVGEMNEKIKAADGILVATPIYNYNVNSSLKNLIELTGQSWTGKIVGFICAAGGRSSYMSIMGIANSLMCDFRTWIVPRFVYVTGEHFEGIQLTDEDAQRRVDLLLNEWQRAIKGLKQTPGEATG